MTTAPPPARGKPFTASNGQIWTWALGGIAAHAMIMCFGITGTIYVIGFGLSAVMVSWAHILPRLLDAALDPILGHWSDNTHTRWGRRKPFMMGSAVLGAIMLVCVWWSNPAWGEWAKFFYLLGFGAMCYICYGIYAMAWTAFGYELSDDYNERARVAAYGGLIITVLLLANSWTYWFALRPMFGNEVVGMRWISAGVAILIILSALTVCIVCKERFTHANIRKHEPMLPALRKAVKNRPFFMLLIYKFFQLFGERVYAGVLVYINIFYVCAGNKDLATKIGGIAGAIGAFWGIATVPFIRAFSRRFGKRGGLVFGAAVMFVSSLAQPLILDPKHPYLLLLPAFLLIPVTAISNTMQNAILPDICDMDELETGERREGLFTAVMGFLSKMEISGTFLIVGYLLQFAGFNEKLATQPPAVLHRMYLLGVVPNIFFTLGALVMAVKFPMDEKMTAEVRRKLDEKHKVHPDEAPEEPSPVIA